MVRGFMPSQSRDIEEIYAHSRPSPELFGHLDAPTVRTVRLGEINHFYGWVFLSDEAVVREVQVLYENHVIGSLKYGLQRDDVLRDHPKWSNAKYSGFEGHVHVPAKPLEPLSIIVQDNQSRRHEAFKLDVREALLRQQIVDGSFDLARLEPVLLADAVYRSVAGSLDGIADADRHCPSWPGRSMVGGSSLWAFGFEGGQCLAYLKLLGELKPTDRVLDVGCGCGRNAIALHHVREYTGFDIVPGLIEQAKTFVRNPKFRFLSFDLYSRMYNPKPTAIRSESFTFPFPDGNFDFVMLISVFTHMLPRAFKQYVRETARVLAPEGRCFATFFLRQNDPSALGISWDPKFDDSKLHLLKDEPDSQFFSVIDPVNYDAMVVYDRSYVAQVFEDQGLLPTGGPWYGTWNNYPDGLWYQDILVYHRPKSGGVVERSLAASATPEGSLLGHGLRSVEKTKGHDHSCLQTKSVRPHRLVGTH